MSMILTRQSNRFQRYVLVCALLLSGCNMLQSRESAEKQKEALKTRIEHYNSLKKAIIAQSISVGLPVSRIHELYGQPDDIFSSGSSTGQFEIWTYEQISPSKENPSDLKSIRLYINNEKLVSWTY